MELAALVREDAREALGDVRAAVVTLWHGAGDCVGSLATYNLPRGIYSFQTLTQIRQPTRRPSTLDEPAAGPAGAYDDRAAETARATRPAWAPATKPASTLTTESTEHDWSIPSSAASPSPPWP